MLETISAKFLSVLCWIIAGAVVGYDTYVISASQSSFFFVIYPPVLVALGFIVWCVGDASPATVTVAEAVKNHQRLNHR